MSYLFDGVDDRMAGTFTSTYADPVTIACFVKVTAHPIDIDYLLAVGNNQTVSDQSYRLSTPAVDNQWAAIARTTSEGPAIVTLNIDGVWAGLVGVFSSNTLRDLYVQTLSNTAQNITNLAVADVLKYISVGSNFNTFANFNGRIAECAIWNIALNSTQITSYLAGTAASTIAAANLIGYWPMSSSAAPQANLGTDADGDLTVTGAVFSADHPTITSAPVVTDVDTDESITGTQANVVITGTSFGATQGAGHVKVFDGSLSVTPTIDTWAATSIQFDMSIGTSTGIRYGARTLRVTDNAAAFGELAITVTAPAGVNFVNLTTLAAPADRLTSSPDMASGDQLEWSNVVGGTIADVTVFPDGSFSFIAGVTAFNFRVHDVTTGWGASATVTTAGLVPTITTTTLPNGAVVVDYNAIIAADGDAPITWSIVSGAIPLGTALDAGSGGITGQPNTAGVHSFTARATNSFGTDDQALSITVRIREGTRFRFGLGFGFSK